VKWILRTGIAIGLVMAASYGGGQSAPAPEAERASALAFEAQGSLPEAEAAWRTFLKAHPEAAEAYAHLGLLEARQEHYKEAVPYYRKALALAPAMPGLRLNFGLALFKSGELKEAIQIFEPMLKQQAAGSAEAQRFNILLGMAHYGRGEYAEAVPYFKEATSRDAQNLGLRLVLAHSCLWSKQYQCVLNVDHEILALNAESAEADMLAGEAQDELKNAPGAIEEFRNAVKANPLEPNVHFGLGYLLWTQRIYPEAATEFKAELANDPEHVQAMLYLADTYIQLNQPENARPLLAKVVQRDPSQSLAHLDLGILMSDANQNEDALRELSLAEMLKPTDVNVHWRLGKLYRTMGRKDDAKAEFEKASRLNKEADEDLVKKMTHAGPPQGGSAQASPGTAPATSPQP
jgi:tetratricopeptide (TPR) repeat protein